MLRYHDSATPLNWTMTAWSSWAMSTTNQNQFYQFFRKRFNYLSATLVSVHIFFQQLTCSVMFFPFEKLLLNVRLCKWHFWWCHIWRDLHITMLQCWAKFSNGLVHWSVRMIHAKNYKTVTKYVKVMPRILWPLFSSKRSTWIGDCLRAGKPSGCVTSHLGRLSLLPSAGR